MSDVTSSRPLPSWDLRRVRMPNGRLTRRATLMLGAVLLLVAVVVGSASGAYGISGERLLTLLWSGMVGNVPPAADHLVFFNIRLPRLLMKPRPNCHRPRSLSPG